MPSFALLLVLLAPSIASAQGEVALAESATHLVGAWLTGAVLEPARAPSAPGPNTQVTHAQVRPRHRIQLLADADRVFCRHAPHSVRARVLVVTGTLRIWLRRRETDEGLRYAPGASSVSITAALAVVAAVGDSAAVALDIRVAAFAIPDRSTRRARLGVRWHAAHLGIG